MNFRNDFPKAKGAQTKKIPLDFVILNYLPNFKTFPSKNGRHRSQISKVSGAVGDIEVGVVYTDDSL